MNIPSQLRRDLLSTLGLNPFVGHNSSPRAQMDASHLGQKLVIANPSRKRIKTGMEYEFGKYTFSVKTDTDINIIKTIPRYRQTLDKDSIKDNPETLVIYEEKNSNRIGVLNLKKYCSYHQHFGFEYKEKDTVAKLYRGADIPKDTILLDSPAVTDDGDYMYGRELNIAYMSHPSVSEDGIMICEDVLPFFRFKTYETRVVEWGNKKFPLNLYGTHEEYKAFPDIGEYVRDDNLLMVTRTYEDNLAPVEMSIYDVMIPDFIGDKCVYANGKGGKVIDIKVYTSDATLFENHSNMDTQVQKYLHATKKFHQTVVQEWERLKKERGASLQLTPRFQRQIVESLAYIDYESPFSRGNDGKSNPRITKEYRKSPIDHYRVEFVIEYETEPADGYKYTDQHGGKGVIVHIGKPEEFPVDADGNRADIVMDGYATVNRMNTGRIYEQYLNAASRDVTKRIRSMIGVGEHDPHTQVHIENLFHTDQIKFDQTYRYLMGYYEIVSPQMFRWFGQEAGVEEKINHLAAVVYDGVYLYCPPETTVDYATVVKELEKHYKPTYGPVTYKGYSGRTVTTKEPVRIGSVYMMLLEKTGDDWAAVSSGKLQHFGILSQITRSDKYSSPTRNQPVRAWGESEGRIIASYAGEKAIAELMDRNNNPHTHKQIVSSILSADKPTNIEHVVDRSKLHYGGSKPLIIAKHVLECAGIRFVYHKT